MDFMKGVGKIKGNQEGTVQYPDVSKNKTITTPDLKEKGT